MVNIQNNLNQQENKNPRKISKNQKKRWNNNKNLKRNQKQNSQSQSQKRKKVDFWQFDIYLLQLNIWIKMIHCFFLISRHGRSRLTKWYSMNLSQS